MTRKAAVSSKQAQAQDKGTGWGMNVLTSFLVEWGGYGNRVTCCEADYFSIGEKLKGHILGTDVGERGPTRGDSDASSSGISQDATVTIHAFVPWVERKYVNLKW
jgi:hypothetical protein